MRKGISRAVACAALSTLLLPGRAWTHHSFAAEFDANQVVELTGIVTQVNWQNPHVYFYIDVVVDEEADEVENWGWEMGSPNGLQRRGWRRDTLQIGDLVTVTGTLARDGRLVANARTVVLAETGQRLFAGTSEPGFEERADD